MANLARVRVAWSGSPVVGPGVSTFYMDEAGSGWTSALQTFFNAIKGVFPSGISWSAGASGDLIDVATGELSGTWVDGAGWTVTSTTAAGYAAGVGARVTWQTGGIRNGRRVQGSTFLCPLAAGQYENDGTISGTTITTLTGAATTYLGVTTFQPSIYSRPSAAGAGIASAVVSHAVPDKVSWLRTRRT